MGPGPLGEAASALRYWELRQQVATNNLANAETPGFKAERAFARQLEGATLDIGAQTDISEGAFKTTGNPLDVSLQGALRFLVVSTGAGERLSRGGALRLDDDSRLVDAAGRPLLQDDGSEIMVPPGSALTIDRDGSVAADGVTIGVLRVDEVPGPEWLEHEAAGVFRAMDGAERVKGPDRGIRQGMLEDSNTSTLDSLVELITIQRAYAAVQGSVRTLDGVMDTVVNRIGRVG